MKIKYFTRYALWFTLHRGEQPIAMIININYNPSFTRHERASIKHSHISTLVTLLSIS